MLTIYRKKGRKNKLEKGEGTKINKGGGGGLLWQVSFIFSSFSPPPLSLLTPAIATPADQPLLDSVGESSKENESRIDVTYKVVKGNLYDVMQNRECIVY